MPRLITQTQKGEQFSYLQACKKRFIDEFIRIKERYELNNIVLVLDLPSARIISGLFSITELVEHGIVFIERLEVTRKPLDHHAIYFISPTEKSVDLMLSDYQSQKGPQYRKAHILFTSSLDKLLMQKISKNKEFLKKLARHSFKEFYFQLSVLSDNCVHLSTNYLPLAFSQDSFAQEEARAIISKRFIDLVSCYESLNVIRIYYESSANKVAERVAQKAAKELKSYLYRLLESKSLAIRQDAPDVTIFVTDRSIDVITPIIHGYAYQSLLYDIVNLSENESEGTDPNKLKGDIFDEFRHRHLSHALSELPERLKTLADKINGNSKIEAIDIKKMKEEKENLEIHIQLLRRLWEKFKEKKLGQLGELELCLSTGVTEDGKQTSSTELYEKVISIIKNSVQLSPNEIIRLALLTIMCIKLSKEDYQALLALFKQDHKLFGIKFDKKVSKSTKSIDKTTMERARTKLQTQIMPSERFTCALEIILPRLIEFLKLERNRSEKKFMEEIVVSVISKEMVCPKFDEKRLICFMCGGLSQTEICSIRKNSALSNIVLAADSILTPNQFVSALGKIDLISKNANSE